MADRSDIIIIGAGMAGASIAAELAPERRVVLLEAEDQPGRHATGRSAAMFFESYGNATVRALTRASRGFLKQPPDGFTDVPLLSPRGALFVSDELRVERLDALLTAEDSPAAMRRVDSASAREICPILGPDWVAGGVIDESGYDLDVAALHQGYLRAARRAGARIVVSASDTTIERYDHTWRVTTRAGQFEAPVLVNAAGAWGDVVARLAGVKAVGLRPLRRSCAMIPLPPGCDPTPWPMVIDVDELFYFKPDAGQLLLSPANEDPMDPCDAVPEELDIAIAVDRFETATSVRVTRVTRRWAGLRSFVADRSPVAGFDEDAPGFFWLVAQGGYGIQMAPALARSAAALVLGRSLPEDIRREGVTEAALSRARLELGVSAPGGAE